MTSIYLIGKVITDIQIRLQMEIYGLDKAEVFLELDHVVLTTIPFFLDSDIQEYQLPEGCESIFSEPKYHTEWLINPLNKTMKTIVQEQKARAQSLWRRLKRLLAIQPSIAKDYRPYAVEYHENRLHKLKNQTITDLLEYEDSTDKCFIELGNGMLITAVAMAHHGTGNAGLHWFENLESLEKRHGTDYRRLSEASPKESE